MRIDSPERIAAITGGSPRTARPSIDAGLSLECASARLRPVATRRSPKMTVPGARFRRVDGMIAQTVKRAPQSPRSPNCLGHDDPHTPTAAPACRAGGDGRCGWIGDRPERREPRSCSHRAGAQHDAEDRSSRMRRRRLAIYDRLAERRRMPRHRRAATVGRCRQRENGTTIMERSRRQRPAKLPNHDAPTTDAADDQRATLRTRRPHIVRVRPVPLSGDDVTAERRRKPATVLFDRGGPGRAAEGGGSDFLICAGASLRSVVW